MKIKKIVLLLLTGSFTLTHIGFTNAGSGAAVGAGFGGLALGTMLGSSMASKNNSSYDPLEAELRRERADEARDLREKREERKRKEREEKREKQEQERKNRHNKKDLTKDEASTDDVADLHNQVATLKEQNAQILQLLEAKNK